MQHHVITMVGILCLHAVRVYALCTSPLAGIRMPDSLDRQLYSCNKSWRIWDMYDHAWSYSQ